MNQIQIHPKKWSHLAELYYQIGKQFSKLELQSQTNMKDRYIYTPRINFLDVDCDVWKNRYLNNRTILINEIVFDFDPKDFKFNKHRFVSAIIQTKLMLDKLNIPHTFWHSGSKGVHCHAYDNSMFYMSPMRRSNHRYKLLTKVGAELKTSESVTITLEYAHNAKTMKDKLPIDISTDLDAVLARWD